MKVLSCDTLAGDMWIIRFCDHIRDVTKSTALLVLFTFSFLVSSWWAEWRRWLQAEDGVDYSSEVRRLSGADDYRHCWSSLGWNTRHRGLWVNTALNFLQLLSWKCKTRELPGLSSVSWSRLRATQLINIGKCSVKIDAWVLNTLHIHQAETFNLQDRRTWSEADTKREIEAWW